MKEKRELFGKNRIAVGGSVPENSPDGEFSGLVTPTSHAHRPATSPCVPGRKTDTSKEPVFFHSGPYALDEELVMGHAIGAINDLTPGALEIFFTLRLVQL